MRALSFDVLHLTMVSHGPTVPAAVTFPHDGCPRAESTHPYQLIWVAEALPSARPRAKGDNSLGSGDGTSGDQVSNPLLPSLPRTNDYRLAAFGDLRFGGHAGLLIAVCCCADMAYRAVAGFNGQGNFHSQILANDGNLDLRRVQLGPSTLESERVPE